MTKVQLAAALRLTSRRLFDFETGRDTPTPETLAEFARVLDFPVEFFEGPSVENLNTISVSFRALSRMRASQRMAALAAGSIALELSRWINDRFGLPAPNLPDLRQLGPEEAAVALRSHWGLGECSVKSMVHLLEAHGVRVFSLAERCVEVDAFSFWKEKTPFVFLNTMKTAEHSRFDAAHELGHLVLHGHGAPNGREAEQQANAFAAAFLMPRASIIANAPRMPTFDTLIRIKTAWNVSASALARRLHEVGLLSDWHYRMLMIELGQRFKKTEPNGGSYESSQILHKVFTKLRDEGVTKADVARALRITTADLDALVFGLVMTPVDGGRPAGSTPSPRSTHLKLVL